MRHLAFAAVLALVTASSARAEPLDFDLARLGAPDPSVWTTAMSGAPGADPTVLARQSRTRFAILSSVVALALSSAVLQPASTIGVSGLDVDLEVAMANFQRGTFGMKPAGISGDVPFSNRVWPTRSEPPTHIYLPSLHVRKGLPFSMELGGRAIYLAQSSYYAAQGEAKWAVNEGIRLLPDIAIRASYTRLFGQVDWNLGTTDLDLMISKRFSFFGVTVLTPYLAGRLTWVSASSKQIDFAPTSNPDPLDVTTLAAFPHFSARFFRTTGGLRFAADSVALVLEGTYFAGSSPSDKDYGDVEIPWSLCGAAKLAWSF